MTRFFISIFSLIIFLFIFGCSSADCTKKITTPDQHITSPSGGALIPGYTIEVPCDYKEAVLTENTNELKNFSYEVLSYEFTPDTGKNTSRLQFEIKLNNPNNYDAVGVPIITLNNDGLISSGNFASDSKSPCNEISANSNCILTYDKEWSLYDVKTKSIEFVTVKYILNK